MTAETNMKKQNEIRKDIAENYRRNVYNKYVLKLVEELQVLQDDNFYV